MATQGRGLTVLSPGGGSSFWVVGELITIKVTGEETNGAYAITEDTSAPQGGPPPHIHHREDEALYVVEGSLQILVGDQTVAATAGSFVNIPKGTLHTFKNVGATPSKVLAVIPPAGFEKFFVEAGEPATDRSSAPAPDFDKVMAAAKRYGLELRLPEGG